MTYKTFEELGISFKQTSSCYTCDGESCHNNVTHKQNGEEYNVHISTKDHITFNVVATPNPSTTSEIDIDKYQISEKEAVKLVCNNFNWFKCF